MYTMLTWYLRAKICTRNEAETLHLYTNKSFNEGYASENMHENWGKDNITFFKYLCLYELLYFEYG